MFSTSPATRRQHMIEQIRQETEYTRSAIGKSQLDARVLNAMAEIAREVFVPAMYAKRAYDNGPLPIGYKQTISQPFIVALMTDLLELTADSKVLEIGTGSGYQSAILSCLCNKVFSVERIAELAMAAQKCFESQGINNVEVLSGNGYLGWPEHAPYDAIIVTAAAPYVPPALLEQLKPGGRMAIPIGRPYANQELMLIEKDDASEIHQHKILDVSFVPLKDEE